MAGPGITIKKRLLFVLGVFTFAAVALLARVGWIQFVEGERFQKAAFELHTRNRFISPKRGTIYDRNGKNLAISASAETISVNPQEIKKSSKDAAVVAQNQQLIANKLSEVLNLEPDKVLKRVTASSRYEIIARKVEKSQGDKIREWLKEVKFDGIYIDEDSKRYYPNKNLAAHVIGFTGIDNQGLNGIELIMEQYLKGVPGRILSEVDAGGRELPFNVEKRIDAQDGFDVVLTIDETIQHLTEKALEKAIDDNKVANGAMGVVMDPRTGEVLALVSKPDFDLNSPNAPPPGVDPKTWKGTTKEDVELLSKTVWRNKAIADTYEPGSTFKAITSAAGLEEGAIRPDSPVNDFTVTVGGHNINCWKPNAHGNETFAQGVYNSCNPVFVRVAQSIGVEKFYKYVKAFGFMDKTNLGLPGEGQTIFHKKPTEVDMATASFGQRFQITPVHLVSAYSAIANGGKLVKPQIIKEIRDSDGNIISKSEPQIVRNVISQQTADTLKEILEGVVSIGTGKNAYVKGYRVAGKTGTSETLDSNRYIASFCAFAPADNPVIVALVALDNPQVYPHTGGMIAAPVAGKLVDDILSYMEIERRYNEMDKELLMQEVFIPDLVNKSVDEAKKILKEHGLEYKIENKGNTNNIKILEQTPKPNVIVPQKSTVILYTYKPDRQVVVKVPDLTNKTISEATKTLNDAGLNIKVEGIGTAVLQNRKAGDLLPKGEIVEVVFRHLNTE